MHKIHSELVKRAVSVWNQAEKNGKLDLWLHNWTSLSEILTGQWLKLVFQQTALGFEIDLLNVFVLLNTLNKPHPKWLIRCYQAFMSLGIMISKSSLALSAQIHVTRLSAYFLWLIKLSPHFCSGHRCTGQK